MDDEAIPRTLATHMTTSRLRLAVAAMVALSMAPVVARAQVVADEPSPRPGETCWSDGGRRWCATRVRATADAWRRAATELRVRVGRVEVTALVGPEVLVGLGTNATSTTVAEIGGRLDLTDLRPVSMRLGIWRARSRHAGVDGLELTRRLGLDARAAGTLTFVTPDLHLRHERRDIAVPPDDPRYPGQWYLAHIGIEDAWRIETGNESTTIVVIDNGCDLTHPDLVPRLDPGYDVFDQDEDPSFLPGDRGNEHGTACAGIVGAAGDNGIGIAGACPECRVRCIRLLGPTGSLIPISSDVQAFELADEWGAAVVSNSWGFEAGLPVPGTVARAMESLYDEGRGGLGSLVVFAAGNDSRELDPAEITGVRGVVTVGAINNFDEATSFSNSGIDLDVTAPTGTLTTDIQGAEGESDGEYTSLFGGTSSSCPVVAGVAGLLFAAAPDSTAERVGSVLNETARPAPFATPGEDGHDLLYGYGIVDPAPALRALVGEMPDLDAGPTPADAGMEPDSGSEPDLGTTADSGPIDSGATSPKKDDDGCGCGIVGQSTGESPAAIGGLLLAVGGLALRSRRRGAHRR